jgi:hypothetical protein
LRRVFGLRFLAEAALIVLVAAVVWYEDVSRLGVVAAIAGAWLVVALGEWLLSRREPERLVDLGARHVPGTEPAAADTAPPAVALSAQPAPNPEPQAPAQVGARHVPGTEPAAADASPAAPAPAPAAEGVETLPAGAEPREWNVWELERASREAAGSDVARDEERSFLLMYLREFADPDGMLPATFDALVRETFGDVLGAVRP